MREPSPSLRYAARLGLAGLAVLTLAACNRPSADWREDRSAAAQDPPSGYLRPPQIAQAARGPDGGTVLSGQAEPDVRLRLASPDGGAYGATADDAGRWSLALPASAQVRLFGLSEETAGRVVQGEGYIAVLPAPSRPAVVLRGGAGAALLEQSPTLQIAAVDFDAAGGAVVTGTAAPGAAIRGAVDGTAAGETHASPSGRFSMALAASLHAGAHKVEVASPNGHALAQVLVSAPRPAGDVPYVGQRLDGAWRIDWLTPGGGPQSTVVFDPAGSGA